LIANSRTILGARGRLATLPCRQVKNQSFQDTVLDSDLLFISSVFQPSSDVN